MEEFACHQALISQIQKDVVKQRPEFRPARPFAGIARAARILLAATVLLTLVASNIVWRATASGPLCAMACCAGKAPHAAGSCMNGACESEVLIDKTASSSPQHIHDHHKHQASESDNIPQILAGVTAGACGVDMEQVSTIDATSDQPAADNNISPSTSETETNYAAASADTISQPCQPGCGASASGVAASKRSRNTAALARSATPPPPSSVKLAGGRRFLANSLSAFGRHCAPRGPPASFS